MTTQEILIHTQKITILILRIVVVVPAGNHTIMVKCGFAVVASAGTRSIIKAETVTVLDEAGVAK